MRSTSSGQWSALCAQPVLRVAVHCGARRGVSRLATADALTDAARGPADRTAGPLCAHRTGQASGPVGRMFASRCTGLSLYTVIIKAST